MTHGNSYDDEIGAADVERHVGRRRILRDGDRRPAPRRRFVRRHPQRTATVDGWVSLEVSPLLAYDAKTRWQWRRQLHQKAARPNLFIKIPGTPEGRTAIEEAIFAGVSVNVTLLFSRDHYLGAAEAYMRGLERRVEAGLSPDVRSVASLFVSRWDKATMDKVPADLRDKLGPAIGAQAYKAYRDVLESDRWQRLENLGARAAAAAVRQHRNERSQSLRRALHRSAGRAEHRRHHAGRNSAGLRRAWQCW